ncbi:putative short-chain dehydrogenase [Histomonas meleagridis]|uniref:putative short-chain dehydrogenase n=1 Tax=Histomonas meleagridis TaxID=135588 RepID=UPI00355A7BA5|nr:putative short-chain dehydrogenase [Histomonas meleagridis]KAH0800915.1 putative short-chain dehydrogenase [Histomonas meleagridis]
MSLFSVLLCFLGIITLFRAVFYLYKWAIGYFAKEVDCKKEFKTEWAIVTGANSDLGKQISEKLAAQGINIIGCDSEEDRLQDFKKEIESKGIQFIPVCVDKTYVKSVDKIFDECGNRDIGILFCNMGYSDQKQITDMSDQDIADYLNTITTAYCLLTKSFIKRNRNIKEKSTICIISSLAAHLRFPMPTLYFSTNGLLSLFGKEISFETSVTNIKITTVHTGFQGEDIPAQLKFQNPSIDQITHAIMTSIGRVDSVEYGVNSLVLRSLQSIFGPWLSYYIYLFILKIANMCTKSRGVEKVKKD